MNLISKIQNLFAPKSDDPSDVIASLLLAAKEDSELHKRIVFLLGAPSAQRESLVNSAIYEMRLHGESTSVCAAFALLIPDEGAKAALHILNSK